MRRADGIPDLDLADFRLGFDAARHTWLRGVQARSLRWPWLEHLRDRALAPLGVASDMREVAARNWALANAVMDMTDTDAFVDASKERLRTRYLDRYLPAPPRVIHLVRDVRGVVESTMRRAKRNDPAPAIAREWARTNESIGSAAPRAPAGPTAAHPLRGPLP